MTLEILIYAVVILGLTAAVGVYFFDKSKSNNNFN